MATGQRIMLLGIGNPDCGDDGIGPLLVESLAASLPPEVDCRIRNGDMLGMVGEWTGIDCLVVVDAALSMGMPGKVHRIDARQEDLPREAGAASSHSFGLPEAIALADALGSAPAHIIVFAVEGLCFEPGSEMTDQVRAATGPGGQQVMEEIRRMVRQQEEAGISCMNQE